MSVQLTIVSPQQIHSKNLKECVKALAKSDLKSSEILLKMEFVASDEVIEKTLEEFKIIKNKIYFEKDNKERRTKV